MSFPWTYKNFQLTRRKTPLLALESFGSLVQNFVYLSTFCKINDKVTTKIVSCLYEQISPFKHYLTLIIYGGSPYDISLNGSLLDIPDEPPCYVRQCSLYAYLILYSLYEICLGVLHYISLYALSLHSTLPHLRVPFLHMLGGIRELVLCYVINSNYHYI